MAGSKPLCRSRPFSCVGTAKMAVIFSSRQICGNGGRVPGRHQDARAAEPDGHLKPAIEAGIVEERRGASDDVALVDAELDHRGDRRGDARLVRDEHRLGQAGRAAGEDDAERAVVAELPRRARSHRRRRQSSPARTSPRPAAPRRARPPCGSPASAAMTARARSTSSGSTKSAAAPTFLASADISGAVMRKEKCVSTAPARAAAKCRTAYCGVLVLSTATFEPLPRPCASSALATRFASRSASANVMRTSPATNASLSGRRTAEKCRNSPVNMRGATFLGVRDRTGAHESRSFGWQIFDIRADEKRFVRSSRPEGTAWRSSARPAQAGARPGHRIRVNG